MKSNYKYTITKENELKYGTVAPQRVNAKYTKAYDERDRGNKQLEALPENLSETDFYDVYFQDFNGIIDKTASKEHQMEQVQILSEIRLPLEFSSLMEEKLHLLLLKSYRIREKDYIKQKTDVVLDGKTFTKSSSYRPSIGGDPDLGLSIIGEGGCGKSTAVKQMLSHYPQVIIHEPDSLEPDIQIVWLMVTTAGTGSLKETYCQICNAVDIALNTDGLYGRACEKQKQLAGMANLVAKLVQKYSIGVIAIDEIQGLAGGNNKASSFDTLLQITNTTKCVIMTIGTEAALKTIFGSSHQSRRAGYKIRASDYTRDSEKAKMLISLVMRINWFLDYSDENPFIPTEEMLEHYYRQTYGFIERIILLWEEIQYDYIRRKTKPEITVEYFDSIARKLFSREEQSEKETEISSNSLFLPSENAAVLGTNKVHSSRNANELYKNLIATNISLDRAEAIEAFNTTFDPELALDMYDRIDIHFKERGNPQPLYIIKDAIVKAMKYKYAHTLEEQRVIAKIITNIERKGSSTLPSIKTTIPTLSKADLENIKPTA